MQNPPENSPLVSIIVITYNSSKYVIETLESCKTQTYSNIELIISDDGSADETVNICEKWIAENKERFVTTKVITAAKNSGISANCNRGLKASEGDWVKLIAGDDALLPNCIEDNISFVRKNPDAQVIHSNRLDFQDDFCPENFLEEYTLEKTLFSSSKITAQMQHEILLRANFIAAPTAFIKKSLLSTMNGFDERIPMVEDLPFWLKVTSAGYKLFYLNKATIKYRVHSGSTSSNHQEKLFSSYDQKMLLLVHAYYIFPNIPFYEKLLYKYNFKRMDTFNYLGINKKTILLKKIDKITGYPSQHYRFLKIQSILTSVKKGN